MSTLAFHTLTWMREGADGQDPNEVWVCGILDEYVGWECKMESFSVRKMRTESKE